MNIPDDVRTAAVDADCLCTEQEVARAIEDLALAVTGTLADANPIALCVMNGGLIFAGQLLPKLRFPLQMDYLHATRYGHNTTGEEVEWLVRPTLPLADRTVLIIDDILDEGHTLAAIISLCRAQGAKDVQVAVLVEKIHTRCRADVKADFVGLRVEDRFLFGCGMDLKGYWRNLPAIYAMKEQTR